MERPRLLTTEDVAKQLSVSIRTVRTWRSQKKGPPYMKINGHTVRYSDEVLAKWEQEQFDKQFPPN